MQKYSNLQQDVLCSREKWRILFPKWFENNPTNKRAINKNTLEDVLSPEDSIIYISAHTQVGEMPLNLLLLFSRMLLNWVGSKNQGVEILSRHIVKSQTIKQLEKEEVFQKLLNQEAVNEQRNVFRIEQKKIV